MAKTTTPYDWVQHATRPGKIERIEAYFGGYGYAPHRHDTYAIGLTLAGVQSFQYRRAQRHSLPGTILVLHPDELHMARQFTSAYGVPPARWLKRIKRPRRFTAVTCTIVQDPQAVLF